ncbi:MAG TPA: recombinase family protein, partial [Ruminococcus sp.]
MYIDGGSTHTIAQELNNKKYPTRSKSGKWSAMLIKRILQNEKYIGDCLLQKTYTIDCISHKAVKNNGERPMYYVSDCHPAIIDKATFNIVQQEIARRNAKRSVCTNTVTEQGRYNSKYALTELLICGECSTAYRRCRWTSHNRDRTVWRCINRLEHGPKYCKSPTIDEEPLHNAIVRTINEFYNCSDDVAKVLKSAADTVLSGSNDDEIKQIKQRLKDIDQARNDFVNLIATGACASDSLDDEFSRLYSEEEQLSQKPLSLKAQAGAESNELADTIKADINNSSFELRQYDDALVRKVIECVKILGSVDTKIICRFSSINFT